MMECAIQLKQSYIVEYAKKNCLKYFHFAIEMAISEWILVKYNCGSLGIGTFSIQSYALTLESIGSSHL